jgi:hypothetical protein
MVILFLASALIATTAPRDRAVAEAMEAEHKRRREPCLRIVKTAEADALDERLKKALNGVRPPIDALPWPPPDMPPIKGQGASSGLIFTGEGICDPKHIDSARLDRILKVYKQKIVALEKFVPHSIGVRTRKPTNGR